MVTKCPVISTSKASPLGHIEFQFYGWADCIGEYCEFWSKVNKTCGLVSNKDEVKSKYVE